mmetsp:Transcript_17904/g.40601  ORF Transcript_17904/g.40601 Transcript_17904/m.40601 type:complete len:211 (+) Transcript_17904:327-959(+)
MEASFSVGWIWISRRKSNSRPITLATLSVSCCEAVSLSILLVISPSIVSEMVKSVRSTSLNWLLMFSPLALSDSRRERASSELNSGLPCARSRIRSSMAKGSLSTPRICTTSCTQSSSGMDCMTKREQVCSKFLNSVGWGDGIGRVKRTTWNVGTILETMDIRAHDMESNHCPSSTTSTNDVDMQYRRRISHRNFCVFFALISPLIFVVL